MANKYVYSGAGGIGDGTSWADAYTSLTAGLAGVGAGDTVWVSHQHAENVGTDAVYTGPGTVEAPVKVLCVNSGAEPPTALATTATITGSASGIDIALNGFTYYYGITFTTGASTGAGYIRFGYSTSAHSIVCESCAFVIANTSASSNIRFGCVSGSSQDDLSVILRACSFRFGHTSQTFSIRSSRVRIYECSINAAGSAPSNLVTPLAAYTMDTIFSGCNFAHVTGNLVVQSAVTCAGTIRFENCKFGNNFTVVSGTNPGPGAVQVFLDNCDSADTNYRMAHHKYQGSTLHDTATYKTGGASDGTTSISHKMDATAGAMFTNPLVGPWITVWNEAIGSAITVAVDILHDSVTALQDDEVWLEVEYLGTSGFPLSLLITDRMTNILSTPADQTASAAAWTEALANDNKQKLAVTFTPREKGLIRARVCLAKDYTIYVDPRLIINDKAIPGRQFMIPGGTYENAIDGPGFPHYGDMSGGKY